MVKGVARRVILVNSPEPKLFEQAIFLVREEAFYNDSPDQVLKEAEQIAKRCLHHGSAEKSSDLMPLILSFLCGSGLASLLWWVALLL